VTKLAKVSVTNRVCEILQATEFCTLLNR